MARYNFQRKVCDSQSESTSDSDTQSSASVLSSESDTSSDSSISSAASSNTEVVSVRDALAARSVALANGRMVPLGTLKTVPSHVTSAVAHDLTLQSSAKISSVRMRQIPGQEKLGMLKRAPPSTPSRSGTAITTPIVSSPAERNSYRQAIRYRTQLAPSAPVPAENQHYPSNTNSGRSSCPKKVSYASNNSNGDDLQAMLDGLARVTISDNLGLQPEEVVVTLKPHQLQAVDWMMRCEQNNKLCGGILADDMGLGKTVQSLSLLLAHKPNTTPHRTLVIAPTATLGHWRREAQSRIRPGLLRILVYHGTSRKETAESLAQYDLVITSYGIVVSEWGGLFEQNMLEMSVNDMEVRDKLTISSDVHGPLFKINWRRIILDEAHVLKNRKTQKSLACSELIAKYRWCLSGTPIQNSIEDVYSLLRFLRISTHCRFSDFQHLIQQNGLSQIRLILNKVMLRRTKATIDSSIKLPQKFYYIHRVDLSMAERIFYDCIVLEADYTQYDVSVLQLFNKMMRMRQSTSHPSVAIPSNSTISSYFRSGRKFELTTDVFWTNTDKPMSNLLSSLDDLLCRHCHSPFDYKSSVSVYRCGALVCCNCADNDINSLNCTNCKKQEHSIQIDINNPDTLKNNQDDNGALIATYTCQPLLTVDNQLIQWFETKYADSNVILPSSKMRRILSILKTIEMQSTTGEKTVIFSEHLNAINILSAYLSENGFSSLIYHGSLQQTQREKILEEFASNPQISVLIISKKAGAVGINLTCANHIIIESLWWNPAIDSQAIDRVYRIGQSRNVHVHILIAKNTVDQSLFDIQEQKRRIINAVFGDIASADSTKLSKEDILDVLRKINPN